MRVRCCGTAYILLYDTETPSILSRKNRGSSHYSTASYISRNMKLNAGGFPGHIFIPFFFGYLLPKFNKNSTKKGIWNEILK